MRTISINLTKNSWFEISEPLDDGSNELIITAEGVRAKFPEVDALVAAAPAMPHWKIIALKPAQGFDFVHNYGPVRMNPREMFFLPLKSNSDPSFLGLRVGIPGLAQMEESKAYNSTCIVLDTGLGERRSAERIQRIETVELPADPEKEGYIELTDLPDYLDWLDRKSRE